MSEVVSQILRAVGEAGRPVLHAVVLGRQDADLSSIVARLENLGCRAVAVQDEASAAALLSGSEDFNALIVPKRRSRDELEALLVRVSAGRKDASCIALINLDDSFSPTSDARERAADKCRIHQIGPADLPIALDAVNQSLLLTTGEMQRQVEIIARAVIKLGQRLHSMTASDQLAAKLLEQSPEISDEAVAGIKNEDAIAVLRSLIQSRRLRDRFFREARFGEPAWDILLDLALAWFEKKSVSASSVCIASGVPMSTAMRWINEMVEVKLIERWIDPSDGRRNLVQIAPATRTAMLRYIAALKQAETLAITEK